MVSKVSVMVGRTYNLGNYESMRLEVGEERLLAQGDDVQGTYYEAAASAKVALVSIYNDLMSGGNTTTKVGGN